jgi:hypothetical protein
MRGRADPAPTLVIFIVILVIILIDVIYEALFFNLLYRYKFIIYLK